MVLPESILKQGRLFINAMEFFQLPKNKLSLAKNLICVKASLTTTQQTSCLSLSREFNFTGTEVVSQTRKSENRTGKKNCHATSHCTKSGHTVLEIRI